MVKPLRGAGRRDVVGPPDDSRATAPPGAWVVRMTREQNPVQEGETHVHRRDITLTVNGEDRTASAEDRTLLSDHLRDGLGLTGTHVGCEHGVCGACTVLVDGEPVR